MKKKVYEELIDAPREVLWDIMWNEKYYSVWTAPFSEGSRVETDWQEGSRVLFLNEEGEGMIAVIDRKQRPELMSFKHLGMRDKEGREDFDSEKVKNWAGAEEKYFYIKEGDRTRLKVEMDLVEEYQDFFNKTWPLALKKIKELSENKLADEKQ